jgi:hypothetical protein
VLRPEFAISDPATVREMLLKPSINGRVRLECDRLLEIGTVPYLSVSPYLKGAATRFSPRRTMCQALPMFR